MNMRKLWIIVVSAMMLPAGCTIRSNFEHRAAAFEKEMSELNGTSGNVGLSVVFVRDNDIVYNHNFGYKDLSSREPLDDSTLFRIASISKSFSATSIMQLIKEGKVTLDTDASTLAGFTIRNPRFPDTVITLEMLLSHTSSLNDSLGYFTLDVLNPVTNPDWEKCYNEYEPGKGYEYCNLNFNLTGAFIEKLSGERFDQYVVHHILDPLGLYGGYCVDSLDASRFATLYEWDGENFIAQEEAYNPRREILAKYRPSYDTPVFSPTGGMKISALDLAEYMVMHMNYGWSPLAGVRIIEEEYSKDMQVERSEPEHYGLALRKVADIVPVELVGHMGSAYGMHSAMLFNPTEKYGFIAISNGTKDVDEDSCTLHTAAVGLMYKHFIE